MSIRSYFAKRLIGSTMSIGYWANRTIEQQRVAIERIDRFAPQLPRDARIEEILIENVSCEWISDPRAHQDKIIFFIHGGGFSTHLPRVYRSFCYRLCRASHMRVLSVQYRLAPEFPYPAALEDIDRVYRALRSESLDAKRKIFLVADSAGAALALSCLQRWRSTGIRLPLSVVLISPWVDLSLEADSLQRLAARDPILNLAILKDMRGYFLKGSNVLPQNAQVSPLFGDFSGLPPLLILAGSEEILLDDFERLNDRARAQGVSSELKIWPNMWHCFPMASDFLPETQEAIQEATNFLQKN